MADRAVLSTPADLLQRWPLPAHPDPARELLRRWSEPHRRYHDLRHLDECLRAADGLAAGPLHLLALWCHDAVHTNTPGSDEAASAQLAGHLLDGALSRTEVREVQRLVLVTVEHRPEPSDAAGAVVSDADLWVLGASPQRYRQSVADLRVETGLSDRAWSAQRAVRLRMLLAERVYHAPGSAAREAAARLNLTRELAAMADPERPVTRSG